MAGELGISRQSLYYKPKLPEKDLKLKAEIEKVMADHKAYGHKRIALELKINKKRIIRVMKLFGLKPQTGFKLELGHPECYSTIGELIEAIAQQIHYYNNQRIHTALKCPPAVFAQRIAFSKLIKKVEFNNPLLQ